MNLLEHLRSYRIGPFAIFDFSSSLAAAWYIGPYLGLTRKQAMLLVIPSGILVHKLLGIETPLNSLISSSSSLTAT